MKTQANHVAEVSLGGSRRSPMLRVLGGWAVPEDWEPTDGVPESRMHCPSNTYGGQPSPCQFVRCRYNLLMVEGESMPGRRWSKAMPGSTLRVNPANLHISCALDVAMSNADENVESEEVALVLGLSTRQVRRILESARKKLAGNPDAAEVLERMAER